MSDLENDDGYCTDTDGLENFLIPGVFLPQTTGEIPRGLAVYGDRVREVYDKKKHIPGHVPNVFDYWMLFMRFRAEDTRKECPKKSHNRGIIWNLCQGWSNYSGFGDAYASLFLPSQRNLIIEEYTPAWRRLKNKGRRLFLAFALYSVEALKEAVRKDCEFLKGANEPDVVFRKLKSVNALLQIELMKIPYGLREGLLADFLVCMGTILSEFRGANDQAAGGSSSAGAAAAADDQAAGGSSSDAAPPANGAAGGGSPRVGDKRPCDGAAGEPLSEGAAAGSEAADGALQGSNRRRNEPEIDLTGEWSYIDLSALSDDM